MKRLAAENAHGAEVGKGDMPDFADEESRQPVSEALQWGQGAGFGPA